MTNAPQQGFSLIELMVATAVSLILILLITQSALLSHRNFQLNNAQQEVQESGWAALNFLRQDIQQADYWGCIGSKSTIKNRSNISTYSPASAISGQDNNGINQSDSIRVLRVAEPPTLTSGNMSNAGSPIDLEQQTFKQFQTAVISDCINSDIFTITDVTRRRLRQKLNNNPTWNGAPRLSKAYPEESRVYRIVGITYELRTSNGVPTLYRQYDTANAQALLENIEQMQILYGENTNNVPGPERYLPIDQIDNLTEIHSVQITLNVSSSTNSQQIKRSFSAVIPLFNRL